MSVGLDANFAVGPGMSVIIVLVLLTGLIAQWKFFERYNYAGIYSIIPIWNFVIWMRILRRPPIELLYFLIPVFNVYFYIKLHIELCKMLGKTNTSHFVLAIIFSVFYISLLGMSNNKKYVTSFLESKNLL